MIRLFCIVIFIVGLGALVCAQETYNRCDQAASICPTQPLEVNNIDANSTFCNNCEDDFNFCFTGENTIWFYFDTNEDGGDVLLSLSNLIFETNPGQGNALQAIVFEADIPCRPSTYVPVSECEEAIEGPIDIEVLELEPETRYYVVINGQMGDDSNAEATFNLSISGEAIDISPSILIEKITEDACDGDPITFEATIEDCENQQEITWYADGEEIGETQGNQFTTTELYDGAVVTASAECLGDCSLLLSSNAISVPLYSFFVDAGPDFEILEGESVQLQGSSDEDIVEWSPSINMSNSNSFTPVVSPTSTTQYFLSVSNGVCSITDFCEVVVISALKIPNTFSPNGDGINDTWEILGIQSYPDCFVQVYDRWGQLVFQTTGYSPSKFWDGTSMNGRELAPSAYYYVINLRDEEFPDPIKGHVSIVR